MDRFEALIAELGGAFETAAEAMLAAILAFIGGSKPLDEAQEDIDLIVEALAEDSDEWAEVVIPEAYTEGARVSLNSPNTPDVNGGALTEELHVDSIDSLIDDLKSAMKINVAGLEGDAKRKLQEITHAHLLESMKTGVRGKDQARALRGELEAKATEDGIKFTDKRGRRWTPRRYTEMVLRTHTISVANQANLLTASELDSPGVFVSDGPAVGGNDTDKPCEDANESYWTLPYAMANLIEHPNCRRAFAPLPRDFDGAFDKTDEDLEADGAGKGPQPKPPPLRPKGEGRPGLYKHVTTKANAEAIRSEGFSLEGERFGKLWGDGIYLTDDDEAVDFYTKKIGADAETLSLRVDARKVLTIDLSGTDERAIGEGYELGASKLRGGVAEFRRAVKEIEDNDRANREEARRLWPPMSRDEDPAEFDRRVEARRAFWADRGRQTKEPRPLVLRQMAQRDGYDAIEIIDPEFRSDVGGNQLVVFDPKKVRLEDEPEAGPDPKSLQGEDLFKFLTGEDMPDDPAEALEVLRVAPDERLRRMNNNYFSDLVRDLSERKATAEAEAKREAAQVRPVAVLKGRPPEGPDALEESQLAWEVVLENFPDTTPRWNGVVDIRAVNKPKRWAGLAGWDGTLLLNPKYTSEPGTRKAIEMHEMLHHFSPYPDRLYRVQRLYQTSPGWEEAPVEMMARILRDEQGDVTDRERQVRARHPYNRFIDPIERLRITYDLGESEPFWREFYSVNVMDRENWLLERLPEENREALGEQYSRDFADVAYKQRRPRR